MAGIPRGGHRHGSAPLCKLFSLQCFWVRLFPPGTSLQRGGGYRRIPCLRPGAGYPAEPLSRDGVPRRNHSQQADRRPQAWRGVPVPGHHRRRCRRPAPARLPGGDRRRLSPSRGPRQDDGGLHPGRRDLGSAGVGGPAGRRGLRRDLHHGHHAAGQPGRRRCGLPGGPGGRRHRIL